MRLEIYFYRLGRGDYNYIIAEMAGVGVWTVSAIVQSRFLKCFWACVFPKRVTRVGIQFDLTRQKSTFVTFVMVHHMQLPCSTAELAVLHNRVKLNSKVCANYLSWTRPKVPYMRRLAQCLRMMNFSGAPQLATVLGKPRYICVLGPGTSRGRRFIVRFSLFTKTEIAVSLLVILQGSPFGFFKATRNLLVCDILKI